MNSHKRFLFAHQTNFLFRIKSTIHNFVDIFHTIISNKLSEENSKLTDSCQRRILQLLNSICFRYICLCLDRVYECCDKVSNKNGERVYRNEKCYEGVLLSTGE